MPLFRTGTNVKDIPFYVLAKSLNGSVSDVKGTIFFNKKDIQLKSETNVSNVAICSKEKIDLTNKTKLHIKGTFTNNRNLFICLWTSIGVYLFDNITTIYEPIGTEQIDRDFDISSYSGEYYYGVICLGANTEAIIEQYSFK